LPKKRKKETYLFYIPIMNRLRKKSGSNLNHHNLKKKIKYLGINITKEVKDLYNQNYKTLKKVIVEDVRR
jgi:UDP-N-acetylglucosamine pyrophosphorylase